MCQLHCLQKIINEDGHTISSNDQYLHPRHPGQSVAGRFEYPTKCALEFVSTVCIFFSDRTVFVYTIRVKHRYSLEDMLVELPFAYLLYQLRGSSLSILGRTFDFCFVVTLARCRIPSFRWSPPIHVFGNMKI